MAIVTVRHNKRDEQKINCPPLPYARGGRRREEEEEEGGGVEEDRQIHTM